MVLFNLEQMYYYSRQYFLCPLDNEHSSFCFYTNTADMTVYCIVLKLLQVDYVHLQEPISIKWII